MRTIKVQVRNLLIARPEFRERRNRYKLIWNIILEKYNKPFWGPETFLIVGPEILTITRMVNKIQEEQPELRGLDYSDKKRLTQEVQVNLGYTPGYAQQVKKLDTLTGDDDYNDEDYNT